MTDKNDKTEALEFKLAGPPTAEELAAASNTCRRLAFMLEQLEGEKATMLKAKEQADCLRGSSIFLADWIRITAAIAEKHQS